MEKTIDFKEAQKPVILASTYTLLHTDDDGQVTCLELNGEERVVTRCPECGQEHSMSLDSFHHLAASEGFDLYGTSLLCALCSAARNA